MPVRLLSLVIALWLVPSLCAQLQLVGQDAPEFHAKTLVNPPADEAITMHQCKGDVLLFKYWGPK